MTINPHPVVLTAMAEQRRADLQVQADHAQRARRAAQRATFQAWLDLTAVITVVVAFALLFAAGSAVAEASPRQDAPRLMRADGRTITQGVETHLLDPGVAQAVSAARL